MIFAHIAKDKRGTSLIETVVSLALFSFLIAIVNVAFNNLLSSSLHSKQNLSIVSIANEQMEIARNLPYASIGTDTGEGPAYGILNSSQVIIKDNVRYTVKIAVNAIDDPFDEKSFDESGSDLIPFDYKQITLEVNCEGCQEKNKIVLSSVVSPKLQEQHGVTGTLKVSVISAAGTPVDGAEVKMTNNSAATPSTTTKITPPNGRVDFLGLTPAVNAYRIEVSKAGFSSAQTYPLADTPFTPTHPDITIVADTVVTETLKIDQLSTLTIRTTTAACGTAPAGTITFKVFNDDKIGTNPDTFQYQRDDIQLSTDGNITIPNIRWGIYSISLAGNDYSITSTLPNLPVTLPPGANNEVTLVLESYSNNNLLVSVKDASTSDKLPVDGAKVKITPSGGGASQSQFTGQGHFVQTTWEGGELQAFFPTDETPSGYWQSTAATTDIVGTISIYKPCPSCEYISEGELESSTFDAGALVDFITLKWNPQNQPDMGNDFYPVNFQIATTDVLADPPENTLWNFIGPNGTDQTYYTSYESSLRPEDHTGKRYLRYKVFLSTADTSVTPEVDDVSIIYSSQCIGPGQAFFENMTAGNYDIEVTHPEYVANTVSNIQISGQTIQDIKIVKPEPEAPLAGDIIVNVVNSSNSPINDATVTVFQGDLNDPDNPNVVSKQTGTNGDAQFHLAPGTYDARATSDQYSTDRTYTLGDPALQGGTPINPSPTIADNETVVVNLMIDSLGSLTLNQKTYASCAENTGTLNFTLRSKKIIATLADGGTVPKFEQTLANATSPTVISNLEWGEYEVALAGTSYSLAGIMPNSIFLSPSETADATLILDTYSSNNLLLTLSNPENRDTDIAKITVSGGALTTQKYAGHGAIFQTDWSGGGWQQTVGDPKMYFVRSLDIFGQPNIKKDTPSGQISLKQSINGNYPVPGYLYSSTFDTGINGPIEYTNLLWSQQSGSPGGTFFSIATTSNVNNEITIGGSISSASLAAPSRVTEKNGKLFIADTSNNRVLIFNSIPTRDSKDADVVLGQPDYILGKPNFISGIENNGGLSASSLFKPNGVFSDGTKLYIADTGNNRVLIYNSIPTTSNKSADIVLGQQNFTSNGINGGAGAGSSSANSLNQPDNIFVSDARLFIADTGNHRVLIHDFNLAPLISNRNADIVIGQPNFNSTSNTAGIGRKGLNSPTSVASEGTKLFVADNGNHRVLVYDPIPIQSHPQAEFVLGQVDFNGNQANQGSVPTVSRLSYPRDIHAIGSKLFIADTDNNRVLIHNFDISSLATNRNADVVIGQPDFISNLEPSTPSAFVLKQPNGVFSDGTNLFILDKGFNRALVFNQIPLSNQASANIVIGQPDMSRDESNSANAMWYYHGPQNNPGGFYSTVDPINPLHDNQRYLRYGVQFSAQSTVVPYPIEDITILYKTQCSTPNQAYFGNLSNNTVYTVNVSNIPGVTALQKDINVSGQTSATINISSLTE